MMMSWIVGIRVNSSNRSRPLTVGFFGTALSPLVLVWSPSPFGILLFTLVEALFSPLYDIPFEAVSYKALETDPDAGNMRVEYMVAREIPLNLGEAARRCGLHLRRSAHGRRAEPGAPFRSDRRALAGARLVGPSCAVKG